MRCSWRCFPPCDDDNNEMYYAKNLHRPASSGAQKALAIKPETLRPNPETLNPQLCQAQRALDAQKALNLFQSPQAQILKRCVDSDST